MAEEWGEWQPHNGGAMPVEPRQIVQVRFRAPPLDYQRNPFVGEVLAGRLAWWHDGKNDDVVAFRVKRPRGLTMLQEIAKKLDVPSREGVEV